MNRFFIFFLYQSWLLTIKLFLRKNLNSWREAHFKYCVNGVYCVYFIFRKMPIKYIWGYYPGFGVWNIGERRLKRRGKWFFKIIIENFHRLVTFNMILDCSLTIPKRIFIWKMSIMYSNNFWKFWKFSY